MKLDMSQIDGVYLACGYTDMRMSIDGLAESFREDFIWTRFKKPSSFSAEEGATGSRGLSGMKMDFSSFINDWRMEDSNGLEAVMRSEI